MKLDPELIRPAVFGLVDGSLSILGVVLYASGHGAIVFPIALSGGLSAAVSMSGGEWLSASSSGPAAAVMMGCATLTGSVIPAFPYLFLHGWHAPALSLLMLAVVAYVVARLRSHREHPYLETAVVLLGVVAVSVLCAVLLPGGTG